jgi:hypothetical protein
MRPLVPRLLDGRDTIRLRIQMLPGPALSDHAPVPIGFQHGADFLRFPRDKAAGRFRRLAVVKERAPLGEVTVWRGVRHLPSMDDHALKVDQIDRPSGALVESEQSIPGQARSRSKARTAVPARLSLFCSTGGIALSFLFP